ncbi:MAG: hypothetical protein HFE40_03890 [Clostridia bacterium]|nr:hypothetical protein [Clostridia bacterium]
MIEWYKTLSVLEQVYFWLGIVATVFLIIQIIMLCFTSFGGDVDIDGDGDIDVDTDSGVSIFTVKSITAFFAVGCWAGLLTCALCADNLQWVSVISAIVGGAAAMAVVVLLMRAMLKLQSNGAFQPEKLVGKSATVYVSIPAERSGRGKITLTAQGKFMELDAMTDGARLTVDEAVEIISNENECMVVKKLENKTETAETEEKTSETEAANQTPEK